jgi:hypothetical protein
MAGKPLTTVAEILATPRTTTSNVHNAEYPGGAIRGQLEFQESQGNGKGKGNATATATAATAATATARSQALAAPSRRCGTCMTTSRVPSIDGARLVHCGRLGG